MALASPISAFASVAPALDQWIPQAHDRMLVDVQENVGYLIHADGSYVSFPVATGQKKVVSYIGRTYFAATPEKQWTIKSIDIKGDRTTFGTTGRFLRLYGEDGKMTPYGIHGYAYQSILEGASRYRSMGCIIVSEKVLSILERTFASNEGAIRVLTTAKPRAPYMEAAVQAFLGR